MESGTTSTKTMPVIRKDLSWEDQRKFARVLKQIKAGQTVAVVIIDGTWRGYQISARSEGVFMTSCRVRSANKVEKHAEDLVGVYRTDRRNKVSGIERLLIEDLLAAQMLTVCVRRRRKK